MTDENKRQIQVILDGLNSRDRQQKLHSLVAIGILGIHDHADIVIDLLGSQDIEVLGQAIETLGLIGNPRSFRHLTRFVLNDNEQLSEKAITALCRFDLLLVLDEVITILTPDLPTPLRTRLLSLLSSINDHRVAALMNEVLYQSQDPIILKESLAYFSRFPSRNQFHILKSFSSNQAIEVALGAHIALTRLSEEASRQQLRRLLKSPSSSVRLTIARGLAKVPLIEDREFFEAFIKDSSPEVRLAALDGMHLFTSQERFTILLEWIRRERDESLRLKLLSFAIKERNLNFFELFVKLLSSPSAEVKNLGHQGLLMIGKPVLDRILKDFSKLPLLTREQLVIVLGNIRDEKTIGLLTTCIRSSQRWLRLNAIEALATMEAKALLQEFVSTLKREEDIWVRATLVSAISKLGDQSNVPVISENLKHPDARVRANSVEALWRLCGKEAQKLIGPFLRDPSDRVRVNAAIALWKMGDTNVVDTLLAMTKEPTKWIKASATYALGEMQCHEAVPELLQLLPSKDEVVNKNVIEALVKIADIRALIPLLIEHQSGRISEEIMGKIYQRFSRTKP